MDRRIEFYTETLIVNLPTADAITWRLKKILSELFKSNVESWPDDVSALTMSLQDIKIYFSYLINNGVEYDQGTKAEKFDDIRSRVRF